MDLYTDLSEIWEITRAEAKAKMMRAVYTAETLTSEEDQALKAFVAEYLQDA